MSTTPQRPRGRSRSVMIANAAISVALLILVGALALAVKPPAPPGIAEFAPEAAKAITKAPPNQASHFGGSPAGCATGASCQAKVPVTKVVTTPQGVVRTITVAAPPAAAGATTSSAATTTVGQSTTTAAAAATTTTPQGVPSSLQCFSWSDGAVTQTFDPQSPSCVASWPGEAKGNGGATSPGVSATTINIDADDYYSTGEADDNALASFFNSHFEMYGRKINLVFPSEDCAPEDSPTCQQSDAAGFAATKPFASLNLAVNETTDPSVFMNALAADHIVTVSPEAGQMLSSNLTANAPYEYVYTPTVDHVEANLGAMICKSLPGGGNASLAGGNLAGDKRKFAILLPDQTTNDGVPAPEVSDLQNALAACGITANTFTFTGSETATPSGGNISLMLQLRNGGYTTMIPFGFVSDTSEGLMKAAATLGYEPEWIASGVGDMGNTDSDSEWAQGPSNELEHLIGIAPYSKYLSAAQEPWVEAYEAETSTSPTAIQDSEIEDVYHQLLILSSGIQAAGPNLTPSTFAAALKAEQFPNPGAGASPFYQAGVSFSSGTDEMEQDYAAWSWSTSTATQAPGPEEGTGASCDVESGARFSLNTWPSSLPFFASGAACY